MLGDNPRSKGKRWIVAHMLEVTARQFRDPIALVVLMETGNRLFHEQLRARPFGS